MFGTHNFAIGSYKVLMKFHVLSRLDEFFIGLLRPTDLLKLNCVQSRTKGGLDHVEEHIIVNHDNLVRFYMSDHFLVGIKAQ